MVSPLRPAKGHVLTTSFALFIFALFLTAYSTKNPEFGRSGSAFARELLIPIQGASTSVRGGIYGFWANYLNLIGTQKVNLELKAQVADLVTENSRLMELGEENIRLRKLLDSKKRHQSKGIAADVVGYDPSNWEFTITLNRGLRDGVKLGNSVVDGDGLVGQVISVGPTTSQVLLLVDPGSGADAVVQGSRIRGVVVGLGSDGAKLDFVLKNSKLTIGDRVVSSGKDGVYPQGILIGAVVDVESEGVGQFQKIIVEPVVDFERLENVMIVFDQAVFGPVPEEA